MEKNEGRVPAHTVGKPTEWDKVFFDMIRSLVQLREEKRLVILYAGHNAKPCSKCGEVHHELYQFSFYNN